MAFRVELSNEAFTDAEWLYDWLTEAVPVRGALWFSRLMAAIQSLQTFPQRCAYATENERFPFEVRQLLFGHCFRVAHPWPPTSVDEAIECRAGHRLTRSCQGFFTISALTQRSCRQGQ